MLDEMVKSSPWKPTEERMRSYEERELEHACFNIKRLWANGAKRVVFDDTLHSATTFQRAMKALTAPNGSV